MTLSKSGISTSVGVRGARVTSGPHGTFITIGAGGIYYRERLMPGAQSARLRQPIPQARLPAPASQSTQQIERIDMNALVHQTPDEVLRLIQQRWSKFEWSVVTIWGAGLALLSSVSNPVFLVVTIGLAVLSWYLHTVEGRMKTVTLSYDMDQTARAAFDQMSGCLRRIASAQQLWSVLTSMPTADWKRNAGATNLVRRRGTLLTNKSPRFLNSNVEIFSLSTSAHRLYFLPDRLLVQAGRNVSAIPYHELAIQMGSSRFIESGRVPSDALVVDHTWQYVRKDGGPDRRFSNNRQIPVCLYGQMTLSYGSMFNLEVQVSNHALVAGAEKAFAPLRSFLPRLS